MFSAFRDFWQRLVAPTGWNCCPGGRRWPGFHAHCCAYRGVSRDALDGPVWGHVLLAFQIKKQYFLYFKSYALWGRLAGPVGGVCDS